MRFIPLLFLFLILSAAAGAFVLKTSNAVKVSTRDLLELETQISLETDRINMLEAEWTYLNNPIRLHRLADNRTLLRPTNPINQMQEGLIDRLPTNATPNSQNNHPETSPSSPLITPPLPLRKPENTQIIANVNSQEILGQIE